LISAASWHYSPKKFFRKLASSLRGAFLVSQAVLRSANNPIPVHHLNRLYVLLHLKSLAPPTDVRQRRRSNARDSPQAEQGDH
jgi:hypothetical protein